jgi:hypothetical protein
MRPLVASAALVLCVAAGPLLGAGPLDGKTFQVEIARKGTKTKATPGELVFADGKLRSTAHDALGFGEAPYTATGDASATTFTAETKSARQGVMVWKGTATGDAISGEITWHRTRRQPVRLGFKGSLKK